MNRLQGAPINTVIMLCRKYVAEECTKKKKGTTKMASKRRQNKYNNFSKHLLGFICLHNV